MAPMPQPKPSFVERARARVPWSRELDVDDGESGREARTDVDGSEGTLVDLELGAGGDDVAWAQTFATPEPGGAEALAFAAQKRRLMARMFGDEGDEGRDGGGSGSGQGRFGHYVLLRELGDGGMGRVYEAYDTSLDRKVAIKTLLELADQSQLRARLVREAKAMARLSHPNVIRVYEIGESDAGPYIVMEFVEGQTLRGWLAGAERSLEAILTVFRAIGEGLAAIHEAGLVHRDVKPDNVMVDGQGRVMVMDLGIVHGRPEPLEPSLASSEGESLSLSTRTGAMLGTPFYMAPEQFTGQGISARSDQYSFCVSLWEAVYGERPIEGRSLSALTSAVLGGRRRAPARPERAPAWLRAVLDQGLAVEAEQRFASMRELVDALDYNQAPAQNQAPARGRWRAWPLIAIGFALALGPLAFDSSAPGGKGSESVQVDEGEGELGDPSEALGAGADEAAGPAGPVFEGRLDAMLDYELLPDGEGLVYKDSGALWLQRFDAQAPEQLHPGPVVVHAVTAAGEVFFSLAGDQGWLEAYYLPSVDEELRALEGGVLPYFCVFDGRRKLAMAAQNSEAITIMALDDDALVPEARIELGGEPGWLHGLACDPVHGRIAVLRTRRSRASDIRLFELDSGEEAGSFELRAPQVSVPRFSPDGEVLYYLIDRGRGFELEGRTLMKRPRTFSALVDEGKETVAYALSPEGRVAYTLRYNPSTTLSRWPGGVEGPVEPSWQIEVPSIVQDVVLSPDERTLALAERAPGVESSISLVELGSERGPSFVREVPELGSLAWSPDGQRLAYLAEHQGAPRVWVATLEGGEAEVVGSSSASTNMDIVWTPSEAILYQIPGIAEYMVLDPESGRERKLFELESLVPRGLAYSFSARLSPDGAQVALGWNRFDCGLSLIDIDSGREQILSPGLTEYPIGWSEDGEALFTVSSERPTRVDRVPIDGGERSVWLDLERGDQPQVEGQISGCEAVFSTGEVLCVEVADARRLVFAEGLLGPEPRP